MSSTAVPTSDRTRRVQLAARVAAAIVGGYAFAWGVAAAGTSVMFAAGMGFHDAEFLSSLLAVLAWLVAFLWSIAARRAWLPWAVLAGSAVVLIPLASYVQSTQA